MKHETKFRAKLRCLGLKMMSTWKRGCKDTEFDSGHTEYTFEVHWHRWNPMPGVEPPDTDGCYIATMLPDGAVSQGVTPMDAIQNVCRITQYREKARKEKK